ncbi:hypothetical protein [Neptuniibacter sp.]|uniref:hypothetical protein n=1 Tax=Neptuniibacter sp. TaxID=1962643 RepID=UPI00260BFCD9|nr:hypothetical protein [Neptuniibacter sp.]MCP4597828.1 hypothetical protein [Neptuniibacter sp.]
MRSQTDKVISLDNSMLRKNSADKLVDEAMEIMAIADLEERRVEFGKWNFRLRQHKRRFRGR